MKKMKKIISILSLAVVLLMSEMQAGATQLASAGSAFVSVESYEVEEGVLLPGETITINLVLKNSSETANAENVVVTFESANYALLPVYGEDNQVHIKEIEADDTVEIEVQAVVNSMYNMDMAQLVCHFNYVSGMNTLGNSSAIYIPTYTSGKLVEEATVVASKATVGAKSLVSVRYKNASTTDLEDAKLIIKGAIAEEQQEIVLPTVEAGKAYAKDYFVTFNESGIQTLEIQYEYKDEEGNAYTVDCGEYKVNVTEDLVSAGNDATVEKTSGAGFVEYLLLLVTGVAAVVVVVIYIRKK